jgi:hypothetical protein
VTRTVSTSAFRHECRPLMRTLVFVFIVSRRRPLGEQQPQQQKKTLQRSMSSPVNGFMSSPANGCMTLSMLIS